MLDTLARATRTFFQPSVVNPLKKPVSLGSTVVNLDDVLYGDVLLDGNFYFPVVQPDESVIMCVLPVGDLGVEIINQ